MDRNDLVEKYFQRKDLLTASNTFYKDYLDHFFQLILSSDGVKNDKTTQNLRLSGKATAIIKAKQKGIIAGIEEITYLLRQTDCKFSTHILDGEFIKQGENIAQIEGSAQDLLRFERSILNILGRMSGIATATQQLNSLIKNNLPRIAATRKTPWMSLDKKSVAVGGGLTHRLSLADWPLIKDTHLQLLKKELKTNSMEKTLMEAVKRMSVSSVDFFEIEVESEENLQIVVSALENEFLNYKKERAAAILLDNFSPQELLPIILGLQKNALPPSILLEISGQITTQNIEQFAKIPVDVLSLGAITHSVPTFNLSMSIL